MPVCGPVADDTGKAGVPGRELSSELVLSVAVEVPDTERDGAAEATLRVEAVLKYPWLVVALNGREDRGRGVRGEIGRMEAEVSAHENAWVAQMAVKARVVALSRIL